MNFQMLKFAGVALLGAGLLGCNTTSKSEQSYTTVSSQDQAGQTLFSVVGVTPWNVIAPKLQAQIPLSATDALGRVIPTTGAGGLYSRSAYGVSAGIAPPFTNLERSRNVTTSDGVSTLEESKTATRGAGDVPDAPGGDLKGGVPEKLSGAFDELDPFLQIQAAHALFQEYALLNQAVESVLLDTDYEAFVVRMRAGVMPMGRNLPYDVYANLSFFLADQEKRPGALKAPSAKLAEENLIKANEGKVADDQKKPISDIRVLPLLATDNLEASQQARARSNARQLGLAVGLMIQGFGAKISAESLKELLENSQANEFNSLLSVNRLTDNTLQARFGAVRDGSGNYVMQQRIQYVTALIFVPKKDAPRVSDEVKVMVRTTLYDTTKKPGENALPPPNGAKIAVAMAKDFDYYADSEALKASGLFAAFSNATDFAISKTCDTTALLSLKQQLKTDADRKALTPARVQNALIGNLYDLVVANDHDCFYEILKYANGKVEYWQSAWTEISATPALGQFASADFKLPDTTETYPAAQTVLLFDNGTSETAGILWGMRNINPTKLAAQLTLDNNLPIYGRVAAGSIPNTLVVSFPSLKANGLALASAGAASPLQLVDTGNQTQRGGAHKISLKLVPAKVEYGLKLRKAVSTIGATANATGNFRMAVDVVKDAGTPLADAYAITVDGAEFANIDPRMDGTFVEKEGKLVVPAKGKTLPDSQVFQINLQNLIAGKKVKITVQGSMGGKELPEQSFELDVAGPSK